MIPERGSVWDLIRILQQEFAATVEGLNTYNEMAMRRSLRQRLFGDSQFKAASLHLREFNLLSRVRRTKLFLAVSI